MTHTPSHEDTYTVRTSWEGDVMTLEAFITEAEALEAMTVAVDTAEATTIERGIYGDTAVSVYPSDSGDVIAEAIIPGVEHR